MSGIPQGQVWNGSTGRAWVETQELLDQMFAPIATVLAEGVAGRVLDVGCGAGATTLAIARKVGSCTGVDISEPMIEAARGRAGAEGLAANFICANAQSYDFEAASFNWIVSRFGVMFFDDPVAAFRNLRRAAAPGAEMRLVTWRSPADNPFMKVAERAAAHLLEMPRREKDAPGQFGLADGERTERILLESGWAGVEVRPIDFACAFPEKDLVRYFTKLGPVGLALSNADEATRARVIEAARPAFDDYVHASEVRFNAACWLVHARASAA